MGTLTNSLRRRYASLSTAKGRRENGFFMSQGAKCVDDTIGSFEVHTIIANSAWLAAHPGIEDMYDITPATNPDIERISTMPSAPDVIAICRIPEPGKPRLAGRLVIALDGVQDPGNLGTIIRVADWMGVTDIIASEDTADVWSPKVVQATMGAISRVSVTYTSLPEFLDRHRGVRVFGTFLDGKNIYSCSLPGEGIVVMGNEGRGIRREVADKVTDRLFIPPYPAGRHTSESLNVAMATAITLSEFRRNG